MYYRYSLQVTDVCENMPSEFSSKEDFKRSFKAVEEPCKFLQLCFKEPAQNLSTSIPIDTLLYLNSCNNKTF